MPFHFFLRHDFAFPGGLPGALKFLPDVKYVDGVIEAGLFRQLIGDFMHDLFDGLHG